MHTRGLRTPQLPRHNDPVALDDRTPDPDQRTEEGCPDVPRPRAAHGPWIMGLTRWATATGQANQRLPAPRSLSGLHLVRFGLPGALSPFAGQSPDRAGSLPRHGVAVNAMGPPYAVGGWCTAPAIRIVKRSPGPGWTEPGPLHKRPRFGIPVFRECLDRLHPMWHRRDRCDDGLEPTAPGPRPLAGARTLCPSLQACPFGTI